MNTEQPAAAEALPDSDEYWMRAALKRATRAEQLGEVPVGAVVVFNDEIIGEGWNHPISGQDPTAHAEMMAIRQAATRLGNYRLVGASLYVTLEPCSMCTGALVHARIQRLVFGASEPKAGAVGSACNLLTSDWMNHRVAYQGGVLAAACSEQLSAFFRRRRAEQKSYRQT